MRCMSQKSNGFAPYQGSKSIFYIISAFPPIVQERIRGGGNVTAEKFITMLSTKTVPHCTVSDILDLS